ncbi:MAG: WYL domain-containing protein [Acidimicrobiia bacterium]|nr:WYL domain-containing protein [Acidimicrobiia bacterium]
MTTKVERLINLIAILSDTMRPLTQHEIVNTVPGYNLNTKATSRRTFERDKDELRNLGFDISSTPTPMGDYGYKINKDNTFYSVSLTAQQRNIVQCAIAMYSSNESLTSKSLTKLGGTNPENELNSVISLSLPENVDVLYRLCDNSSTISFKYRDSFRRVKTKKLLAKGGYWYLECFDLDKKELRNFRIDRLSDIAVIDVSQMTTEENGDNNEIAEEIESEVEIVVEVHKDLEPIFIREWNTTKTEKGLFKFTIPRIDIFTMRYFDYVGYVKIVEPIELKIEVEKIIAKVLDSMKMV